MPEVRQLKKLLFQNTASQTIAKKPKSKECNYSGFWPIKTNIILFQFLTKPSQIMKNFLPFLILPMLFFAGNKAKAQDWQLVWSDEFNNGISADWEFEIGTGEWGWGNNELQYYRRENATVHNGILHITAKQENYAGSNYTSARMKTQGRKSWKYGRMEARIALPSFTGSWPAFWMLGESISSIGWPACGEIDIMEQVNTAQEVHGTIHWDANGTYANYGGSTPTNVSGFHVYAIEWDASAIRWFLDGVQYHEVDISNGANGTSEFHEEFFILLNMAVGGQWPGYEVDNGALPATMQVDYVRVYERGSTPPPPSGLAIPGRVEAESYSAMSGIQTEGTTDSGGGENVGWIDSGDWMDYQVNVASSGSYQVDFRVASAPGGGQLELLSGNTILATANVPATGGWQNWTTVSANINLAQGNQTLRVRAASGGFNLNWLDFTQSKTSSFSERIEAENYSAMSGVETEATSDSGGGLNVGWIDAGDWMVYPVNIPQSGTYTVEYRVASPGSNGRIRLDKDAGQTILGEIAVPATGGWQNWTTISHTLSLEAGSQNLGIYAVAGGFNLNWIHISSASGTNARQASKNSPLAEEVAAEGNFILYPNPAKDQLQFTSFSAMKGSSIRIIDTTGKQVYAATLEDPKLNISFLSPGIYTIALSKDGLNTFKRFVKE
jgi:beta-glucanase (GH16 family)